MAQVIRSPAAPTQMTYSRYLAPFPQPDILPDIISIGGLSELREDFTKKSQPQVAGRPYNRTTS
jgi:hypothetical protein